MCRERVVLWGTGYIANEIFALCHTLNQYDFVAVIDNDKSKQGKYFQDILIYDSSFILENKGEYDSIVVLTNAYDEVYKQIINLDNSLKERIHNYYYFYKKSILKRYAHTDNFEIKKVIDFLNDNNLRVFNYEFANSYDLLNPKVYMDDKCGLHYVIHNGKKMYFSRIYDTENKVVEYYKSILMEQDKESPHRYLSDEFNIEDNSIVLDVGVAEGNFSLDIIEKVKRIYMVEADTLWVEALQQTFSDYKDKVEIITGYASSYDDGDYITLDSIIDDELNFIKMDIEGCEWDALKGAKRLISNSKNLKLTICSYHSDFDQELIEKFMDENGINHTTTQGYMWFPYICRQVTVSTQLNRGIVRGIKSTKSFL